MRRLLGRGREQGPRVHLPRPRSPALGLVGATWRHVASALSTHAVPGDLGPGAQMAPLQRDSGWEAAGDKLLATPYTRYPHLPHV